MARRAEQTVNEMKCVFPAKSVNEGLARMTVAAFIAQLDPPVNILSELKTAVSEAVTNAIVHAYPQKSEKNKIVIECRIQEDALHIEVADSGCGIEDTTSAVQPFFTTLKDEERSGMGFTIMQTFMNGFRLESEKGKGTAVKMIKRIKVSENGGVDA